MTTPAYIILLAVPVFVQPIMVKLVVQFCSVCNFDYEPNSGYDQGLTDGVMIVHAPHLTAHPSMNHLRYSFQKRASLRLFPCNFGLICRASAVLKKLVGGNFGVKNNCLFTIVAGHFSPRF